MNNILRIVNVYCMKGKKNKKLWLLNEIENRFSYLTYMIILFISKVEMIPNRHCTWIKTLEA